MVVVAEVSIIISFVKFLSLIFVIAGCFSSSLSMTLLWVVRLEVGLGCKVMTTSFIILMILRLRLKPTTAWWSYSVRLLLLALPVLSCRVVINGDSLASPLVHTMIIGTWCVTHTLWRRSIVAALPARLIQVTLWFTSLSAIDGLIPAIATVASVLIPLVHLMPTVVKLLVFVFVVVILIHFVIFVSITVINSLCGPDPPGIPVVSGGINISPGFWTAVKLIHIFVKIILSDLWTIIFHSNCRWCMVAMLLTKSLLIHFYCELRFFCLSESS